MIRGALRPGFSDCAQAGEAKQAAAALPRNSRRVNFMAVIAVVISLPCRSARRSRLGQPSGSLRSQS
jgi:hypothetical protein